jgi:glycosyltransferase involved in cell wall biosynthesis
VRIAYVSRRTWPANGGIESFLRRLYRRMALRHDVTVVAQRIDSGHNRPFRDELLRRPFAPFLDDGVPIRPFALGPLARLATAPLALHDVRRLKRPLHGREQRLAGAAFARLAAPSLARAIEGADVVHVLGGYEIACAGVEAARRLGVPVVVMPFAHPGDWDDDAASAWAYRRADRVIATMEADAQTYRALGVPDERIDIVGLFSDAPPEDLDPGALRAAHGIDGDLVVFLGGRYGYKGFDILLDALPAVRERRPGAQFAFVGPGPPVRAEPGAIDAGRVEDRERWEWLAAADLLALPSQGETYGLVVLEAWATGTAVVTSHIPALAELVSRAGGGVTVPRTKEAVGDAIAALLEDSGRRAALAASGRAHYEREGRPEAVAARFESIYEALLT